MKNSFLFSIVFVLFCTASLFGFNSVGAQQVKLPYDVFDYAQYPIGSVWGDPLPDAPALAQRGKFMVGVQTLYLLNPGQIDIIKTLTEGTTVIYNRPLTVEVWYPATLKLGQIQITMYTDFLGRSDQPGTLVPYTFVGRATRDASPDIADGPYPLIIISHGYPGSRYLLYYLGENLASKGYVVVSVDHTDSTYLDVGNFVSTLVNRSLDQEFVMSEILKMQPWEGLCNPNEVGLIGYSMGGYGALRTLGAGLENSTLVKNYLGKFASTLIAKPSDKGDPLVKAAVLFAPWGGSVGTNPTGLWDKTSLAKITVPTLWVAGSQDDVAGYKGIVNLFDSAINSKRYLLTFDDALHNVVPHPAPSIATKFGDYYRFADPVWDTWRIDNIDEHFVTAFFDLYLKGNAEAGSYLNVKVVNSNDGIYIAGNSGEATDSTYWPGFSPRTAVGLHLLYVSPSLDSK
jgi:predicted dienelactone hydrolase